MTPTVDPTEARAAAHLAIGRLLRIMSRPEQPGDVEEYYRCRSIIMGAAETLGLSATDNRPNWCRDRLHGDITQG